MITITKLNITFNNETFIFLKCLIWDKYFSKKYTEAILNLFSLITNKDILKDYSKRMIRDGLEQELNIQIIDPIVKDIFLNNVLFESVITPLTPEEFEKKLNKKIDNVIKEFKKKTIEENIDAFKTK